MSKTIALENCVQILDNLRKPINSDERYLRSGNIPYYGANGQQGWIDDFIFDEKLVLLAEDGGDFDNYHTKPIAYRVSGKSWVNNHAHVLKAIPEVLDNDYLYWALVHKNIVKFVSGGTRSKLNQSELRKIEIPYFSIEKQKNISLVFNKIESQIDLTKDLIAKLNNKKQGLLNDLLTRGVDSQGNLRPGYEDAPDLYQETGLGFIPKEWEILSVSDFSDFVTSGSRGWASYYAESGALFIRIGNLSRENLDMRFESVVYVNPPKSADGLRTKLQEGDILISITADLGIIGVVPKKFGDAFINQHVALVRPKEGFNSRFIGYYLASSQSQKQIETYNDGGAKAGLNLPTIRNLKVALPNSVSEQNAIAEKLDAINSQILSSKKELNKLEQIKIGLLKDLLQN